MNMMGMNIGIQSILGSLTDLACGGGIDPKSLRNRLDKDLIEQMWIRSAQNTTYWAWICHQ